jgi:hypothetical protein
MCIRITAAVALALCVACGVQAAEPPEAAAKPEARTLEEVVISTEKFDRRTLEREIIPRFVQSHTAPTATVDQLSRWHMAVCPQIFGMPATYAQFVTERLTRVAQNAGAPTRPIGKKCSVDIEIAFTSVPQDLLQFVSKKYPYLLGSARKRDDTTMSRAIQAWYLTGTRSTILQSKPAFGGGAFADARSPSRGAELASTLATGFNGFAPDPEWGNTTTVTGAAGSRLTKRLESALLHVLVIVDVSKLQEAQLGTVTDYIAMITLSRARSLDKCSELPSIIDLLSPACADRARPQSLTAADAAFLKALYRASLDVNLNIEEANIRNEMLTELEGR